MTKTVKIDYYIFVDYSTDLIGYTIISNSNLHQILAKVVKFRHYREQRKKKTYLQKIKGIYCNQDYPL